MENNMTPEQEHNIHEFFKKLLFDRDQRISSLEKELAASQSGKAVVLPDPALENDLKMAREELATTKSESAKQVAHLQNQVGNLNETVQKLRSDYQNLRQQKGGFGFLALLGCLVFGTMFGWAVQKFLLTPKNNHAAVFEKFQKENQFNFEYDITQGNLEKVEQDLKAKSEQKEYAPIEPELSFLKKIIAATRRKYAENSGEKTDAEGFSVTPQQEELDIQTKAKKTLSITEVEATVRSEASTAGDKLGKLKKGETVGVWDRTLSLDKLTMTKDGNRCEVEDYWYKVELKDGLEGWVFGHFTSRSLNRYVIVGDPIQPSTAPATPEKLPVATPQNQPSGGNPPVEGGN